jgi:hypothetical protein
MVKTTRTWVRPDLSTPWWTTIISSDRKLYVKSKFVDVGKMSQTLTSSKDGLTLTVETTYRDQAAYEEVVADPSMRVWYKTRLEYCIKNGITESPIIITND